MTQKISRNNREQIVSFLFSLLPLLSKSVPVHPSETLHVCSQPETLL